jgi:hypothetical protein
MYLRDVLTRGAGRCALAMDVLARDASYCALVRDVWLAVLYKVP